MDRTLNIETNKTNDKSEITEFMNQLENALNSNNLTNSKEIYTTIYDEVLEEIDLAQKYESKLNSIIKECMKNESYENDFWYINYDKSKDTYSMDLYSEGTCQNFPITYKDIQDYNYKIGMTYWAFDDDRMQEAEELKDSIKIDVDSELADLERENNKKINKENKKYE